MAMTTEEKTREINDLQNLINEAKQRGDNVAGLEMQLEAMQAELVRRNASLTKGTLLKG